MRVVINADFDSKNIEIETDSSVEFTSILNHINSMLIPKKSVSKSEELTLDTPMISLNQLAEIFKEYKSYKLGGETNIPAIRKLREITNCGLKPAKDIIMGIHPEYFYPS